MLRITFAFIYLFNHQLCDKIFFKFSNKYLYSKASNILGVFSFSPYFNRVKVYTYYCLFLFQESGSSKLNYIDVVFEPNPHIRAFYIHGADNRTPYADIDFSAKAEPLISSDESDENSSCLENNCDDFVTLEDVQQWNITED